MTFVSHSSVSFRWFKVRKILILISDSGSQTRIDGVWDSNVTSIGSFAYAHTNLTEINLALELLWRNNINPGRVNMGLGFYGRSE